MDKFNVKNLDLYSGDFKALKDINIDIKYIRGVNYKWYNQFHQQTLTPQQVVKM